MSQPLKRCRGECLTPSTSIVVDSTLHTFPHTLTVTEMYEPLLDGRSEMHSTCTGPVTCSTALIMDALNSLPPLPIAVKARWIGYLFTLRCKGVGKGYLVCCAVKGRRGWGSCLPCK